MRGRVDGYRQALKLLAEDRPGIAIDDDCRSCGHPELSGILKTDLSGLLGVRLCRKCGHAELI